MHRVDKLSGLIFLPLESYILVYNPGNLLHLLNVSPEVVPCLHVAFHGASVPISPVMEEDGASLCDTQHGCQTLTHLNRVKTVNTSGKLYFGNFILFPSYLQKPRGNIVCRAQILHWTAGSNPAPVNFSLFNPKLLKIFSISFFPLWLISLYLSFYLNTFMHVLSFLKVTASSILRQVKCLE